MKEREREERCTRVDYCRQQFVSVCHVSRYTHTLACMRSEREKEDDSWLPSAGEKSKSSCRYQAAASVFSLSLQTSDTCMCVCVREWGWYSWSRGKREREKPFMRILERIPLYTESAWRARRMIREKLLFLAALFCAHARVCRAAHTDRRFISSLFDATTE